MTFSDLRQMVKKYWYVMIIVPVTCIALCYAYLNIAKDDGAVSTATTSIVVNSQATTTAGLASVKSGEIMRENPGITAAAKLNEKTMTITIAVTGHDAKLNEECSVLIAEETIDAAHVLYPPLDSETLQVPYEAQIQGTDLSYVAQPGVAQYYAMSMIAGVFVALGLLAFLFCTREPVVGIVNLEKATGIPVLGCLPAPDRGERLLANLRFASKEDMTDAICVIPISSQESAQHVCVELSEALGDEGRTSSIRGASSRGEDPVLGGAVPDVVITCCDSLDESMRAAYAARESKAVVLAVVPWRDSLKRVRCAITELEFAGAPLVGFAFCHGGRSGDRAAV